MLQIIKNNNPLTVLILCIYALVINWQVLFYPQLPIIPEGDFLYHIITNFLSVVLFNSAFVFTLLTVIILVLQSIYLNAVANTHKLFTKPTYIVAFIYISFTSLYQPFGYFSQPLLANWAIIMLIDVILQLSQVQKARKLMYNAGFAIGTASLILFPTILYALLLVIAVAMLRRFNPTELIIALLGVLTPIYFAAGLLYLFDVLHWMPDWFRLGFSLPTSLSQPVYTMGMVVGIILLFIMGTYMRQKLMTRVNIFIRRGWTVLAIGLVISIITAIFTEFEVQSAWLMTMPILTLITANSYYSEKSKAFSNFAFYFTLLLVIFCKVATS